MPKSEFTQKEISEAKERLEAEKGSSVLISRRARLARAAGYGDLPPTGDDAGTAADAPTTTGTAGRASTRSR